VLAKSFSRALVAAVPSGQEVTLMSRVHKLVRFVIPVRAKIRRDWKVLFPLVVIFGFLSTSAEFVRIKEH